MLRHTQNTFVRVEQPVHHESSGRGPDRDRDDGATREEGELLEVAVGLIVNRKVQRTAN
jgi:hypothetical protein